MILRIKSKLFHIYFHNYRLTHHREQIDNGKSLNFSRCKRISLTCDQGDTECYRRPASITFHFITLVSQMSLPPTGRVLFTYKGPSWYENIDFDMKIVHTQAPSNVRRVSDQFFRFVNEMAVFLLFKTYLNVTLKDFRKDLINRLTNVLFIVAWINSKMKPV